ncbi:hypothetical protein A2U01_0100537, partial [Trifolium medium]|nr:hypothetical protein [Trifolium medium]
PPHSYPLSPHIQYGPLSYAHVKPPGSDREERKEPSGIAADTSWPRCTLAPECCSRDSVTGSEY